MPGEILEIFRQDAFNVLTLTDVVNKEPFVPGLAGQVVSWEERNIATTQVAIEEREGVLKLISATARGGPAEQFTPGKRKLRALVVPHLAVEDTVNADEIQNVRELGSNNPISGVQTVVNGRLMEMARSMDVTLEHLRIGALKGTILDADGATAIMNLFDEFNVAPHAEVPFDFATTPEGQLRKKCHDITRTIQGELGAAPMTRVHSFCSAGFFDELTSHAEVRKAYERQADGAFLRAGLAFGQFEFAGIVWQEYRGAVGGVPFIPDDKAIFFPIGTPGLYKQYWSPADFNETVNTPGLPRYAKQAIDPEFQRWAKLHVQSNPLPLVTRPRALMMGRAGA